LLNLVQNSATYSVTVTDSVCCCMPCCLLLLLRGGARPTASSWRNTTAQRLRRGRSAVTHALLRALLRLPRTNAACD
jgi:hypothetical protein